MREKIFAYVKKTYGVEPDYPFSIAPGYPVLRHTDNRKWFALFMDVPRNKLGLKGEERVDIVNVKTGDVLLADWLAQQEGFFPGYHISRGTWVSVLLDGTVPLEEIFHWIDVSFAVTAPKKRQRKQ